MAKKRKTFSKKAGGRSTSKRSYKGKRKAPARGKRRSSGGGGRVQRIQIVMPGESPLTKPYPSLTAKKKVF